MNPLHHRTLSAVATAIVMTGVAAAQNAVTSWNEIAVKTAFNGNPAISPASTTPGGAGIYLAYVHLAMYNAVNAIDQRFEPYGPELPAGPTASADAAASAAAYYTLTSYFPDQEAALAAQYMASLAAIPDGLPKDEGVQLGQAAASALIALRANDGRGAAVAYSFPAVPTPGVWIPTPPAFALPQTPWLGQMQPFTMDSASQFLPAEPPPDLLSEEWTDDYNQVKALGAANSAVRTPAQTEIGWFWTESAASQYGRAFRALAIARGLSLADSARLFAMLWTAYADSFIGCLNAKYHFSFWRPVTAIRNGDIDGNAATVPDPSWTPLGITPNHPEYPAAHGCVTGAVAETLKSFFGTPRVPLVVSSTVTKTTHSFDSVRDLEREVEEARIYAGFHYHHSLVQGFVLGHKVAHQIATRFFRPR